MIAELLADLDDPEEAVRFQEALDGWKYKLALQRLDAYLRAIEKYADDDTVEVAEVRRVLFSRCDDLNINPWE